MRFLMFSAMAVLMILTAGQSLAADLSVQQPEGQYKEVIEGPFMGRIDGTITTIGYCAAVPPTLRIRVAGNGVLSFLGVTSLDSEICSVWDGTGEGTMTGSGTATGANGDQINISMTASYSVPLPPPSTMTITGSYTITGGTGRFEGATGSGEIYGEEDLQDLLGVHDCWFRFEGSFRP